MGWDCVIRRVGWGTCKVRLQGVQPCWAALAVHTHRPLLPLITACCWPASATQAARPQGIAPRTQAQLTLGHRIQLALAALFEAAHVELALALHKGPFRGRSRERCHRTGGVCTCNSSDRRPMPAGRHGQAGQVRFRARTWSHSMMVRGPKPPRWKSTSWQSTQPPARVSSSEMTSRALQGR